MVSRRDERRENRRIGARVPVASAERRCLHRVAQNLSTLECKMSLSVGSPHIPQCRMINRRADARERERSFNIVPFNASSSRCDSAIAARFASSAASRASARSVFFGIGRRRPSLLVSIFLTAALSRLAQSRIDSMDTDDPLDEFNSSRNSTNSASQCPTSFQM